MATPSEVTRRAAIAEALLNGALIIPVRPDTKRPYLASWPKLGSSHPDQINKWWIERPEAMIGVLTGPPSGLWALDVDDKHGGDRSLAELEGAYGSLPHTPKHRTPGGSRYWFRWPKGVTLRSRAGDIAPGLDVRGGTAEGLCKGQGIIPPSVRADGGRYVWEEPFTDLSPAADAPLWLLFLAIFSRRERQRLASMGIEGPDGFAGLLPPQWYAAAREKFRPQAVAGQILEHSLGEAAAQKLTRYLDKAVQKVCEALRATKPGSQDIELNNAGMSFHGLPKGGTDLGLDTTELEGRAFQLYVDATIGMEPEGDPWQVEHAEEKWRRTEGDATARDLSHILREGQTDPSAGFTVLQTSAAGLTTRLSDIQEQSVDWLWFPYIPAGYMTLLGGRGGDGKGLVATSIAAAVSMGNTWPATLERAPRGRVLWCEAEDSASQTLKPRFVAANADCNQIDVVLPKHFTKLNLKTYIAETGTRLIVFSPLVTFLKGLEDINSELAARKALELVQESIEGTGCAVVGITHLNKKPDLVAVERVLGSVAFTNFVRSVLFVACEDRDAATHRFLHAKHNLSIKGDDLLYTPECVGTDKRGAKVRVIWSRPESNADTESLCDRKKKFERPPSARDWLARYLQTNGRTAKEQVIAAAEQAGFNAEAIQKAHTRTPDCRGEKIGFQGKSYWWFEGPGSIVWPCPNVQN